MSSKRCRKCGEEKPVDEFYKASGRSDGLRSHCKPCVISQSAAWQRDNPERSAAKCAAWAKANPEKRASIRRAYKYGLTPARYEDLLQTQTNACAICDVPFDKAPNVDHCHATGAVRALLCHRCNHGLGNFIRSSDL